MRQQQTTPLTLIALFLTAFAHLCALTAVAETKSRKPASWEPKSYDGVGDPNLAGEAANQVHTPSRTGKAARDPYESPWEADANLCLGYAGMKTTATSIGSFGSLLLNIHLSSGFTLDLQGMYALRGKASPYFFAGTGLSWFAERDFVGYFLSINGGLYFGSGLEASFPAGRLMAGVRLHDSPMIGTVGFSVGPEALLASTGTAVGILFRLDLGFRL